MKPKKKIIQKTQTVSPGIIDGVIHHFLPSTENMYYVKKDGEDEYQRDAGGKYVKMSFDECVAARELYLVEHGDAEKEVKIVAEMEIIKADTLKKAKEIVDRVKQMEDWKDGKYGGYEDEVMGGIVKALYESHPDHDGIKNRNQAQAKAFFAQCPNASAMKKQLQAWIDAADYEGLYNYLNQGRLATFKDGDELGLNALVNIFHVDQLEKTLDNLKGHEGNIRIAARAIVEREY